MRSREKDTKKRVRNRCNSIDIFIEGKRKVVVVVVGGGCWGHER